MVEKLSLDLFILLIILALILSTFLVLKSLKDNVIYFKSPSEVKMISELKKKKLELEGWLKKVLLKCQQMKLIS